MKKPVSLDKGPIQLVRWVFRWYCHPTYVEDLEGDLEELYAERLQRMSQRRAKWYYARDVLLLFRLSIIQPPSVRLSPNQLTAMFRNYFKTGLRNLLKYKSYSMLNILGLAVGITATILLFLIVQYEKSFDKFHHGYTNIYQIGERNTTNGVSDEYYLTRTPAFPTMRDEYPEVVGGSRFVSGGHKISYGDQLFKSEVHYVDTSFATTFDFPVLAGNLQRTLNTPNYVALTEDVATKFFGREEAVGQVLDIDQEGDQKTRFTVGAVLRNPPQNSSLQFEILIPWLNAPADRGLERNGNWYNSNTTAFIQLAPGTDPKEFEDKLAPFQDKYYTKYEGSDTDIILLPLEEVRSENAKNQALITLLGAIAIIILVVASVNFMNLTTAQSLGRVKEIGLRKVMGSGRGQLVGQFLTESIVTSLLSLLIAIALVYVALPWVNEYFNIALTFAFWENPSLMLILIGIGLLTGLLSGLYPALFVSGFQLTKSLRGEWKRSLSGQLLQKGLIVVQYTFSILLIAGTLVIWRQIHFMKTQDLNFDQHNVVAVRVFSSMFADEDHARLRLTALRNELTRETTIEAIAFSGTVPSKYNFNYNSFYPAGASAEMKVSLRQTWVDDRYLPTYGIPLVAGRNFSADLASDSSAIIINQAAMRAFGWQDVQEKYLRYGCTDCQEYKVVGVIKDFHYQGLQRAVEPMVHFYGGDSSNYGYMSVRLQPNQLEGGLALLKNRWKTLGAIEGFDYFFIDQEFDQMYKSQERMGVTATLFAFIAIMIASLGLLALAAFSTRQRRKEVGVRKVLGASVTQIIVLLSRNFALLVLVAFLIACPLVYFASDQFLQDFAYHISIGPDIFIIAGVVAFLIAALSVGTQAFQAASANPVTSLRDE